MKPSEVYDEALEKYGVDAQLEKLVEECLELALAAKRVLRDRATARPKDAAVYDHMAEEIADVGIMTEQATRMLAVGGSVGRHRIVKLERLRQRLGKE